MTWKKIPIIRELYKKVHVTLFFWKWKTDKQDTWHEGLKQFALRQQSCECPLLSAGQWGQLCVWGLGKLVGDNWVLSLLWILTGILSPLPTKSPPWEAKEWKSPLALKSTSSEILELHILVPFSNLGKACWRSASLQLQKECRWFCPGLLRSPGLTSTDLWRPFWSSAWGHASAVAPGKSSSSASCWCGPDFLPRLLQMDLSALFPSISAGTLMASLLFTLKLALANFRALILPVPLLAQPLWFGRLFKKRQTLSGGSALPLKVWANSFMCHPQSTGLSMTGCPWTVLCYTRAFLFPARTLTDASKDP